MPSFVTIGRAVVEIWRFNDFLQHGGCHHFRFVWRTLRPDTKSIWRPLSLHKIWLNRCSSFDNTKVFTFGLKMPIHHQNRGFWGFDPPKWAALWMTSPKAHPSRVTHHTMHGPPVFAQFTFYTTTWNPTLYNPFQSARHPKNSPLREGICTDYGDTLDANYAFFKKLWKVLHSVNINQFVSTFANNRLHKWLYVIWQWCYL